MVQDGHQSQSEYARAADPGRCHPEVLDTGRYRLRASFLAEGSQLADTRSEDVRAIRQVLQNSADSMSRKMAAQQGRRIQTPLTWGQDNASFFCSHSVCTILGSTLAGAPAGYAEKLESVKVEFQHAIPNVPRKTLVAVVVNYPPGGKSPPHHHAKVHTHR
jgi:hypothetical protein